MFEGTEYDLRVAGVQAPAFVEREGAEWLRALNGFDFPQSGVAGVQAPAFVVERGSPVAVSGLASSRCHRGSRPGLR